jgi:MarR family transcriptional regulator, lower aerobic nicotinate degradation pathway regulator
MERTLVAPTLGASTYVVGAPHNCYDLVVPDQHHPPGPAPARIQDRPTWLISRAYTRSTGLLNDGFEARAAGLRSYHYRLLAALDEWGPASQADLGRGANMDRSDVAGALNELGARGLIARTVNPDDRRRNIVSITRAGRKQLGILDHVVADTQEQLLAPLNQSERRQLVKLLRRLVDAN